MSITELQWISKTAADILAYSTATNDCYMQRRLAESARELIDAVAYDLSHASINHNEGASK